MKVLDFSGSGSILMKRVESEFGKPSQQSYMHWPMSRMVSITPGHLSLSVRGLPHQFLAGTASFGPWLIGSPPVSP